MREASVCGPDGSRARSPTDATSASAAAPSKRQHERRRHADERNRFARRLERAIGAERPRHAPDPRGERPDGERQRDAGERELCRRLSLTSTSPASIHAGPLPARSAQQLAHRFVLRRAHPRLARFGHQRRGARQRVGEREPRRTRGFGGTRRRGQQRGAGERRRRAVAVERRAEQQHRVGRRARVALDGDRVRAREARLHSVERAGERQRRGRRRRCRARSVRCKADLGVDRIDRIAEREQVAQSFALLQAKLRAPRSASISGRPERASGLRDTLRQARPACARRARARRRDSARRHRRSRTSGSARAPGSRTAAGRIRSGSPPTEMAVSAKRRRVRHRWRRDASNNGSSATIAATASTDSMSDGQFIAARLPGAVPATALATDTRGPSCPPRSRYRLLSCEEVVPLHGSSSRQRESEPLPDPCSTLLLHAVTTSTQRYSRFCSDDDRSNRMWRCQGSARSKAAIAWLSRSGVTGFVSMASMPAANVRRSSSKPASAMSAAREARDRHQASDAADRRR